VIGLRLIKQPKSRFPLLNVRLLLHSARLARQRCSAPMAPLDRVYLVLTQSPNSSQGRLR
jgi:hypothetical protein